MQKCTKFKKFDGMGIFLLHPLKCKGPRSCNSFWMLSCQGSTPTEKSTCMCSIMVKIVRESTSYLFNVSSSLVNRKRETSEFFYDSSCLNTLFIVNERLKRNIKPQQSSSSKQKVNALF